MHQWTCQNVEFVVFYSTSLCFPFKRGCFFCSWCFFSFRSVFSPKCVFFPWCNKSHVFPKLDSQQLPCNFTWRVGGWSFFLRKKRRSDENRAAWRTESFSVEPIPSTLGEVKGLRKQPGRSDSYGTPFCWCELWGVSGVSTKNGRSLGMLGGGFEMVRFGEYRLG